MFAEDRTKRENIDDEKKGTQDRALGHTSWDREGVGLVGF